MVTVEPLYDRGLEEILFKLQSMTSGHLPSMSERVSPKRHVRSHVLGCFQKYSKNFRSKISIDTPATLGIKVVT